MKKLMLLMALGALFPVAMIAQSGAVAALARAEIDAGNQAWIDGVKTGNIALITATYAEDAVDCGPTGEIKTWLLDQIRLGHLSNGDIVPSEALFCEKLSASAGER